MTLIQPAPVLPRHDLTISVGAMLTIPADTPDDLRTALCRPFVLPNPKYLDALEHDRSTRFLDPHLSYLEENQDGSVSLPRGARRTVERICWEHGYHPRWEDRTHLAQPVSAGAQKRADVPEPGGARVHGMLVASGTNMSPPLVPECI